MVSLLIIIILFFIIALTGAVFWLSELNKKDFHELWVFLRHTSDKLDDLYDEFNSYKKEKQDK